MKTKVIITITDTEKGAVNVAVDFKPPAKAEEKLSPSQATAMEMLEGLGGNVGRGTVTRKARSR